MKKIDKTTNFFGYKIVSTTEDQLLKNLISQVESGNKMLTVFTPNSEQLVFAKSHSWFEKVLGKSDILIPDGAGIVIGSQILSTFGKSEPILHRIAGVDVVAKLIAHFSNEKFLIIGGRDYAGCHVDDRKVVSVLELFGKTKVTTPKKVGQKFRLNHEQQKPKDNSEKSALYWHEAFLNVTQQTQEENIVLLDFIRKLKPMAVFVALGAPHQEKWIVDNKKFLEESGVRVAMVVGGSFDVLLGKIARAPKWMQKIGLEWLYRLSQEPWRWRRQLKLLSFIKMVFQEAFN